MKLGTSRVLLFASVIDTMLGGLMIAMRESMKLIGLIFIITGAILFLLGMRKRKQEAETKAN